MRQIVLLAGLLVFVLAGLALGQEPSTQEELQALKRENAELREKIRQLEQSVDEIKKLVLKEAPAAPAPVPEAAPVAKKEEPPAKKKPSVELYGYIKLDAAYDTSRTDVGDFARWVMPEGPGGHDDEFNLTANQTRVGLNINGPEAGKIKTSGVVEIDFYSLEGGENKPQPMMRQAFLKLDWPEQDFSLLAGQTGDVISPLLPDTINYTVGWWVGNIGYRRPQFRMTKGFDLSGDLKLQMQGAFVRTIGHTTGYDPGDSGEDAGFPTFQGRAALTFPAGEARKATVGLWGHWGQEEYDLDAAGRSAELSTYSIGLDAQIPLAKGVTLQGELWRGANVDAYLGGIGQGFNKATMEEISGMGGWATLTLGPWKNFKFNLGGAVDDPVNRDLASGNRARNMMLLGNVYYNITSAVQVGLEVSPWWTRYINLEEGQSVRVQGTFIYRF
mgnify:CR=1 FL=1